MDDDPFRVFAAWWHEENVPMVLATAGPTARAVVLEEFDERGFVFWTSSESPKGRGPGSRGVASGYPTRRTRSTGSSARGSDNS